MFRLLKTVRDLTTEIVALKREKADLELARDRQEEARARQERELRHEIGLERKRQEVEMRQTKQDAILEVREANLLQDRKRFEDNLKFNTDQFTNQVEYLKDLMKEVLNRLPTVTVDKKVK